MCKIADILCLSIVIHGADAILSFCDKHKFLAKKLWNLLVLGDDDDGDDHEEDDAGKEEFDDVKVLAHPFPGQEHVADLRTML